MHPACKSSFVTERALFGTVFMLHNNSTNFNRPVFKVL